MNGVAFWVLVLCPFLWGAQKKHSDPIGRVRPAELRGSDEQRIAQNIRAEKLGIGQIASPEELQNLFERGALVELKNTEHYFIDRGASAKTRKIITYRRGRRIVTVCPPKPNRVFVYYWTKEYLDKLARDYSMEFRGKKLKIPSGARTLEEQRIMRTPGSCYYTPHAAIARQSLEESLHVRGIAIDISRRGMKRKEIEWLRRRLIKDKVAGVEFSEENKLEGVEAEPIEENICYHIVVFPKIKQSAH